MRLRWIGLATLGLVIFCAFAIPWMQSRMPAPTPNYYWETPAAAQEPKKESKEEKLKKIKELEEEGKKEKQAKEKAKKDATVSLQILVPRDCKIIVNDKAITYDKFEVLMEYAGNSFLTEELIYRGGSMTSLKLKTKE